MFKKTNYLLGLIVTACLGLTACSSNPVDGKKDFNLISEGQEINMGRQGHQEIMRKMRPYPNQKLQSYVNSIGQLLAKNSHRSHLKYTFTVVDDPSVNAFALPGGYIYITTGLMAYLNSEAELAGVLGHEIGHVTAKHGVKQQSAGTAASILLSVLGKKTGNVKGLNQLGLAALRGYGREHELESDRLGAEYLARVGYNPENMIKVIGFLRDQEQYTKYRARQQGKQVSQGHHHGIYSTHPNNDLRLQEIVNAAKRIKTANTKPDGRNKYLQMIHGMRVRVGKTKYANVVVGTINNVRTYKQLAQRSILNEAQVRLLNGAFPKGTLTRGQKVKVVR